MERGKRKSRALERARISLALIRNQVESLFLLQREEEKEGYEFSGGSDYLSFPTNYSVWGGPGGYVIAAYSVKDDGDGMKSLVLEERKAGTENIRRTLLLKGLRSLRFQYFLRKVERDTVLEEWVDTWEEVKALPPAIRMVIETDGGEAVYYFPVRVAGGQGILLSLPRPYSGAR